MLKPENKAQLVDMVVIMDEVVAEIDNSTSAIGNFK